MRMRKKKNLKPRLEKCGKMLFEYHTNEPAYNAEGDKSELLNYERIFGNSNAVHLEIGCGKGQFICESAQRNPQINFIAVEKIGNVIVQACEEAVRRDLKNVYFIKCDAQYLKRLLPEHSVARLYLNFSCPYPKKKYENHRLTNSFFLNIYKTLLMPSAEIHQKTDNQAFFEYSVQSFSQNGYKLKDISLDLHNSSFDENIITEYENRFASQGFRIYRLVAYL